MCGHVGIAGKLDLKDEATMKRLLLLDFFRGPDSTGFAAVNVAGSEAKVAKIASHPLDLFDSTRFKDLLSAYKASVFMGHNRAATKGAVNAINAHPFICGHIVGAHNGTLDASSFKELEDKLGVGFDVDSHAIFAAIEKFGIDETMPMLRGAWALVWYDLNEGTLNFLRNKERPFWISTTDDNEKLIWASEWPFIQAATELSNDVKGYQLRKAEGQYMYFETSVDTLYTYKVSDFRDAKVTKDHIKPVKRPLKGKEPAPVTTYNHGAGHNAPFRNATQTETGQAWMNGTTTRGGSTTSSTVADNVDCVHFYGNGQEPWAGILGTMEFESYVKYGCQWCEEPIDICDVGTSIFEKEEVAFCKKCTAGNKQSNRLYTADLSPFRKEKAAREASKKQLAVIGAVRGLAN